MGECGKILVVDDEERLRESLKKMLVMDGFSVSTAGSGKEGIDVLMSGPHDIAIVDLIMPGTDGMWLIDEIARQGLDIGIIVVTGFGTVDHAVRAMKLGAWDFIQKPIEYELLNMVVKRAMEKVRLLREKRAAEERIRLQNEALIRTNRKLKELDKLKANFLSKAVHELRSPLTVIGCTLELVREDLEKKGPPELLTQLDHAITFANNMANTVNEMLDINMIVSGKIKIDMKWDDIADVVRGAAEGTTFLVRKNGLRLEFDIPESRVEIDFSKNRIEQVMINLIGNAVKFTPPGGVIKVSLVDEKERVVVSVSDTGIGIPPENLSSVFDEFFQVRKGDSKKGAGLGLSICKKIIEAHKGEIWVESEEGKGSTFFFSIPKREVSGRAVEAAVE